MLCAQGKHFCAGANFGDRTQQTERDNRTTTSGNPLYTAAVRLFSAKKPIVGAINGSAVGGGFGLAVMPDFRVASPETRFTANFVKLGFHPGFGLTYTLPRLIGQQRANLMFYTGRRVDGETAHAWGLADVLTDQDSLRDRSAEARRRNRRERAARSDVGARDDARRHRGGRETQTDHEFVEQHRLQQTEDHKEGVRAVAERRPGNFKVGDSAN